MNLGEPVLAALALQIPWISAPVIVYKFGAGLNGFVGLSSPEKAGTFGLHFDFDFLLGSKWQFSLFHDDPWHIGVNLIALAILLWVWKARQTRGDLIPQTATVQMQRGSGGRKGASPLEYPET
jgi:hypothetical protein